MSTCSKATSQELTDRHRSLLISLGGRSRRCPLPVSPVGRPGAVHSTEALPLQERPPRLEPQPIHTTPRAAVTIPTHLAIEYRAIVIWQAHRVWSNPGQRAAARA